MQYVYVQSYADLTGVSLSTTVNVVFHISEQAISWFRSYFMDRFPDCIRIDGSFAHKQKLDCGVPQGSVLGPQLFTLYSSPVAGTARRHNLRAQLCADDSQLICSTYTYSHMQA